MFKPIKVVSLDLRAPLKDIENLGGYEKVRVLCKWSENSICVLTLPVVNDICPVDLILKEIQTKEPYTLRKLLLLKLEHDAQFKKSSIQLESDPDKFSNAPLITVAVCTRNRTEQLQLCLDSLKHLSYPNLDLILVDNAPSDNSTNDLVNNYYSEFRYIKEPRPGLNWARNKAILEAQGEIIAFTDDDVIVDKNWITAIAKSFIDEPDTMAITGLVEPYELEKNSQLLFEMYGGFGRGEKPKWINIRNNYKKRWLFYGTGQYGTGANMAFRIFVFEKIGFFDNALDVGTITNGGGDLDILFRILKFGYTLKYESNAVVYHRHRSEYSKLKKQLTDNGIGLYSFIVRNIINFPYESYQLIKVGTYWILFWSIRRLIMSYIKPLRFPRELILAEFIGSFIGLFKYQKASKNAKKIEKEFGKIDYVTKSYNRSEKDKNDIKKFWAVRIVDLDNKLEPILDLNQYNSVRIFVKKGRKLLGSFDYQVNYRNINSNLLKELVIEKMGEKLFRENLIKNINLRYLLTSGLNNIEVNNIYNLPTGVTVSIVIATYDRPDDLMNCLISLKEKKFERKVEIIVVDNHPESGLTIQVLKDFPDIILINEFRKGLGFARNAGVKAASGEIIITTDDDVTFPECWLENLVSPFSRGDIAAVAGNTLPFELENKSQLLFESYGGLGKGFEQKEFSSGLFEKYRYLSFPTWRIGATSNAAFRKEIFNDPEIGYFIESLGPGMPAGVGEDSYMFYKILKSGRNIFYESDAYVLHKHRRTMKSLRKQIFAYSKGHVAYHLTTLFKDRDFRSLTRILFELPLIYIYRCINIILRRSKYSISLIFLEIIGNILGPWAFISSIFISKKRRKIVSVNQTTKKQLIFK